MRTDIEILDGLRENLGVAIIRTNHCGFLYMNTEALAMFRFSSFEEASTFPTRALFAEYNSYQHLYNKLSAERIVCNERILFSRKDKTNFWGSVTSRIVRVEGEVWYDQIIVDITDKVNNEHMLSEKTLMLDKVANELDRFIYSASHDLRSPISTMRGLVSLFTTNSEVFPVNQFLELMAASLDKLETFVSRLVEFSKNSNEPVLIEPVKVGRMIVSILDELKGHHNRSKISVEYSLNEDPCIYTDFNKLYTVISQILKNAFDYVNPAKCSSILSIKAELIKDQLVLEVMDNGIGIDKKALPTVFQMFYRGTHISKGSGLGLFLAREAMIRLGGTIEIKSELGLGTLVILRIPNHSQQLQNHLQMA